MENNVCYLDESKNGLKNGTAVVELEREERIGASQESFKEDEKKIAVTKTARGKAVCFFIASQFDRDDEKAAILIARKYREELKAVGIENADAMTKESVYFVIGRDKYGMKSSMFPKYPLRLNEKVSRAVDIIYRKVDPYRGDEARTLLEEAMKEGDADALFFLGRINLGEGFVPEEMCYEENRELGMDYFNLSLEKGSPYGMLATRRLAGFTPRCGSFVTPPFTSEMEVWEEIYRQSVCGEMFANYLIANTFYFGDVFDMLNIEASDEMKHYAALTALDMYMKQFDSDVCLGISNALDIVTSGDNGVKKDKALANYIRDL